MNAALLAAASGCCAAASVGSLVCEVGARRRSLRSPSAPITSTTDRSARKAVVAIVGVISLPVFGALPAAAVCVGTWVLAGRWFEHRSAAIVSEAERDLPALAYSVAAALAAGVSAADALELASRHSDRRLGRASAAACRRVEAGASLEAALGGLMQELPGQRIAAMCRVLVSGARHGTASAEPVAAIARSAAAADLERRRERAAKAAPLIQLIVALGLVPSVLMLVVAAALARISS
jgi:tight adherence protein C